MTFGTVAATNVTFVSNTQFTATSPPGTGTQDVHVSTGGLNSSASAADEFTYTVGAGAAVQQAGAAAAVTQPAATIQSQLLLINAYRTSKGLNALTANGSLATVAQQYTETILADPTAMPMWSPTTWPLLGHRLPP